MHGMVGCARTYLNLQPVGHNVWGVDDDVVDSVQGLVGGRHVLGQLQGVASQAHNAELSALQHRRGHGSAVTSSSS